MDFNILTLCTVCVLNFVFTLSIELTHIKVDTTRITRTISDRFISVAIDSGVIKRHWGTFQPRSTKVKTLASAITPSYLRVGGTDADFLIFDDGSGLEDDLEAFIDHKNTTDADGQFYPKYPGDELRSQKPGVISRSKRDVGLYKDHTNFTMSAKLYDDLHKFVSAVGFDLIFDLNVLLRKGDDWDSRNAEKLMNYTVTHGYKMAGWELGNEPDDTTLFFGKILIPPKQLAKDFQDLRSLIKKYSAISNLHILGPSVCEMASVGGIAFFNRVEYIVDNEGIACHKKFPHCQNVFPNAFFHNFGFRIEPDQLAKDYVVLGKLLESFKQYENTTVIGPSTTRLIKEHVDEYFESFLTNGGKDVVTGATFHQYYVNGRTATVNDFISPNILNVLFDEVQMGVNLTKLSGSKAAPWIGESSSAWGGGAEGLSDRYVAAFMWLDKLGIAAAWGIDVIIRQTFYGGHYALIDKETLDPNPDYWLTLMYKILVGTKVLRVNTSGRGTLRVYSHCVNSARSGYEKGAIVFYVMNLGDPVQVAFPNVPSNSTQHLYTFTPPDGDIKSQNVELNGFTLKMVDDATLPNLLIPVKGTGPVHMDSLTYSFIVFPNADLAICK